MTYMNDNTNILFIPYQLTESLTLKNRIIMAPMSRNLSYNHVPGADVAACYRRRVEGGVGLIMTEATAINHPAAQGAKAHAGGAKAAPGLQSSAAFMPRLFQDRA